MNPAEIKYEDAFTLVRETPWTREVYFIKPNSNNGDLKMTLVEKADKHITNKIWD